MSVVELRRLRQLEEEDRRLKQLVADLSLDKTMLQEVIRKRGIKSIRRRPLIEFLRVGFAVSERRACQVIDINRTTQRYRSVEDNPVQVVLRIRLRDLTGE